MNQVGENIVLRDDLLTPEHFHRIEEFLLEYGREMIWSSLYGRGMYYAAQNVSVIYSYLGFRADQPMPGPAPLREPFFFIDLFPPGARDEHSARCDAEFTFDIKAQDENIHVRDMTSWYHNRKIAGEQIELNARHAFQVMLQEIASRS